MHAVDMLACNQNSGNGSLSKVPHSTGYLIRPDCSGPGGDLSLYLRCSCYKKEAGRDVSGWNPGAGKVIHLFVPISMWEMWPKSPINPPGGGKNLRNQLFYPDIHFNFVVGDGPLESSCDRGAVTFVLIGTSSSGRVRWVEGCKKSQASIFIVLRTFGQILWEGQ